MEKPRPLGRIGRVTGAGRKAPGAAVDSEPALEQHGSSRTAAAERTTLHMAERFTKKQGQYLAFIYNYSVMFGQSPAEADLQRFFRTSPPTIHPMLLTLAAKQLISRTRGRHAPSGFWSTRKRFPALSGLKPVTAEAATSW